MSHETAELANWINERYAIKLRRESGLPPPWTPDPIMASVRWCNVHREDDKVTKWMRTYWRYDTEKPEIQPVWWWVLGRMLNYIPTLEDIMEYSPTGEHSIDGIGEGLKALREDGRKVFTSAYTISTCGRRMDKIDYVMEVVQSFKDAEPEWKGLDGRPATLESTANWMVRYHKGFGTFLSAQVVADLKNTPGHPLQTAHDWWGWAAPGPGSLRGLNWYFHSSPTGSVTPSCFLDKLHECKAEIEDLIADYVPPMCMQDFQNCMCEFSKYMKVKYRGGHVRNKYHPG